MENEIECLLRLEGIGLGIHFEEARDERGLCIVLECISLPESMESIRADLEKAIEDVPSRRPTSRRVYFE